MAILTLGAWSRRSRKIMKKHKTHFTVPHCPAPKAPLTKEGLERTTTQRSPSFSTMETKVQAKVWLKKSRKDIKKH